MKFNSKGKCVSITKSEYEDVKLIYETSSCIVEACDRVKEYLDAANIENTVDIVFYLVQAVVNDYKYMKVVNK